MSEFITDEVIEVAAYSDALYDRRNWTGMPRTERDRYKDRAYHSLLATVGRLEKAIRADEREELYRDIVSMFDADTGDGKEKIRNQAIEDCAAAIRARGE